MNQHDMDGITDDREVQIALTQLDPTCRDPGFWGRLESAVLEAVRPELERRRLRAELTVAGTLSRWAQAVVPAAIAAAIGALLMWQPQPVARPAQSQPLTFEELLADGLEPDPTLDFTPTDAAPVLFAAESY